MSKSEERKAADEQKALMKALYAAVLRQDVESIKVSAGEGAELIKSTVSAAGGNFLHAAARRASGVY